MKITSAIPQFLSICLLLVLAACALPGLDKTGTPQPVRVPPTPSQTPASVTNLPTTTPSQTPASVINLPIVIAANPAAATPVASDPQSTAAIAQPPAPTQAGPTAAQTSTPQTGLVRTLYSLSGSPDIPAGIFPQIGIFQIGGGSGSASNPDCASTAGQLSWCHPLNGAALTITHDFEGQACGFGSGPFSASVTLPDGTTRPANTNGEPPLCRNILYTPKPNDPLGLYQITVSQGDSRLSDTFNLTLPTAPTGKLDNGCIWMAGLAAGQAIPIQAFGLVIPGPNDPIIDPSLATWRFLGEGSFLPGFGQALWVCPDDNVASRFPELAYLAYPPNLKPIMAGDPDLLQQFQGNCANGPRSRLTAGKNAKVLANDLPMFSNPSLNTPSQVILHQGAVLSVLNGPVCPPQGPWTWLVKSQAGQSGWLAESDTTTYFLEPVQK